MKKFLAALAISVLMVGPVWGQDGGMVIGGPLNGTLLPGSEGGIVIGGPMNGTLLPPTATGGMVIGGPLNGTLLPPGASPIILVPVPSGRDDQDE